MKIGNVEMTTDPSAALKEFQDALQNADALSKTDQGGLSTVRLRIMLLRKQANALIQLGEYSKANALFAEIVPMYQHLVAADPHDLRALADLEVVLDDEALGFENAANPTLGASPDDRRRNLVEAGKLLVQMVAIMEEMLKQDPANQNWKALLADAQVRLGAIQSILNTPGDTGVLGKKGISALRVLAVKGGVSPMILDQAANDFLKAEPASLQDPEFAVSCAQREIALSHGKTPSMMLTMAQAYRASGQLEKSRATAAEGLALLPALPPGGAKPNIRKLLECEIKSHF